MKTIGILGGLGPKATSQLYLDLIKKGKKINNKNYLSIFIYSVPQKFNLEKSVINGTDTKGEFEKIIDEGIEKLVDSGVVIIGVPCNSAHRYLEKYKDKLEVLSIVDETIKKIGSNSKNVAILATSQTINDGLYKKGLEKKGVKIVDIDTETQLKINSIISCIIDESEVQDKVFLDILEDFKKTEVDTVILGCTELHRYKNLEINSLSVIDSLDVLSDSLIEKVLLENFRR